MSDVTYMMGVSITNKRTGEMFPLQTKAIKIDTTKIGRYMPRGAQWLNSCADPEGWTGGPDPPPPPPPPLKNHINIGFSSNTGPDPLKNRSYQASIQF